MITGTCLYRVAAVLLVERQDGSYRPCSAIVDGAWDNYGSIDVVRPSIHLSSLAQGLVAAIQAGSLVVDFRACSREPVAEGDNAATVFRKVVAAIEMDALDNSTHVTLLGRRLRVAMVGAQVANALVSEATSESDLAVPGDLFDWEAVDSLYRSAAESIGNVERLRLVALHRALTIRGIAWHPTGRTVTQFSSSEERIALQGAIGRFWNDALMKGALVRYAQEEYFDDLTLEIILGTDWLEWE